jgi:hypothetical protein
MHQLLLKTGNLDHQTIDQAVCARDYTDADVPSFRIFLQLPTELRLQIVSKLFPYSLHQSFPISIVLDLEAVILLTATVGVVLTGAERKGGRINVIYSPWNFQESSHYSLGE